MVFVLGGIIGAISAHYLPTAVNDAATRYVRLGHQLNPHTASRCERMTAVIGRILGGVGHVISIFSGAGYGMSAMIASVPVEWKCVPNHQGPAGETCIGLASDLKAKAIECADSWFMIGCISTVLACLGYSLQAVGNRIDEVATLRELLGQELAQVAADQPIVVVHAPLRVEPSSFPKIRPRRVTNRLTHNTQIIGGQGNSAEANRFVTARRLG